MTGALAAAFTAGAAAMALEILASRWLAPGFGFTLATWAALIAVTLVAGALGAAAAATKRAASRVPPAAALAFAGASIALTAFVAPPLVAAPLLLPLGLEFGAIAAAAVLVFPAAFALGAVLPLAAERVAARGARPVGALVAASTAGSGFGTLLAALVLAPRFGLRASALGIAAALFLMSLLLTRGRSRTASGAALAVCAVGPFALPEPAETPFRRASPYGLVTVEPTPDGARLRVDGVAQGTISRVATGTAGLLARRQWTALLPYWHPEGTRALQVGLGAGELARALAEHGVAVETIEVNPVLADVARAALGFGGAVRLGDGRATMRRIASRFDFVVLDAFAGESLATHLLTREALAEARERLSPGGLLAIHLVGRPFDAATAAVWRTLGAVFPERSALLSGSSPDELQDLFLFAADRRLRVPPHPDVDAAGAAAAAFEPDAGAGPALTDDRNPLESLHVPAAREQRARSRR